MFSMRPIHSRKEIASPPDAVTGRDSERVIAVSKTAFSHCQVCQRQLEHTALFCPKCGTSACSWECYVKHLASHSREAQPAADERRSADVAAVRQQRP